MAISLRELFLLVRVERQGGQMLRTLSRDLNSLGMAGDAAAAKQRLLNRQMQLQSTIIPGLQRAQRAAARDVQAASLNQASALRRVSTANERQAIAQEKLNIFLDERIAKEAKIAQEIEEQTALMMEQGKPEFLAQRRAAFTKAGMSKEAMPALMALESAQFAEAQAAIGTEQMAAATAKLDVQERVLKANVESTTTSIVSAEAALIGMGNAADEAAAKLALADANLAKGNKELAAMPAEHAAADIAVAQQASMKRLEGHQ